MKNETQNKFAEILAQAQAKAAKKTVLISSIDQPEKNLLIEEMPAVKGAEIKPTSPITTKEAPTFENQKVTGQVQIIDYSEKAVAVIGDTKPVREKLKNLGGKFNFRLSCGPGWIFSKSRLEALQKAFSTPTEEPATFNYVG